MKKIKDAGSALSSPIFININNTNINYFYLFIGYR